MNGSKQEKPAMQPKTYLYDTIASNRRRIILLMMVFIIVVFLEALAFTLITTESEPQPYQSRMYEEEIKAPSPLTRAAKITLGVTLFLLPILTLCAYFCGKPAILRLFKEVEVDPITQVKLKNALDGVSIAAGLEKLDAAVIDLEGINAISLTRGYHDALILVSKGAVENLDRSELEGLLAHEVFHVMAHDTWLWILGMAVGALLPILLALIFTAILEASAGVDAAKGKVSHAAVYIAYFLLFWVVLAILWIPLWLAFQFLVLPRNRDYLADAQAVLYTRNPEAVARVIEVSDIMRSEPIKWGAFTINHMFFNQPLEPPRTLTRFVADLLNTHPSAANRVSRVQSLYTTDGVSPPHYTQI